MRYDVNERKELMGDDSVLTSAGSVTRLKQNSLFACAKSYVERRMAASGPGLVTLACAVMSYMEVHTTLRTSPLPPLL